MASGNEVLHPSEAGGGGETLLLKGREVDSGSHLQGLGTTFQSPDLFLLGCENVSPGWGHTVRLFSLPLGWEFLADSIWSGFPKESRLQGLPLAADGPYVSFLWGGDRVPWPISVLAPWWPWGWRGRDNGCSAGIMFWMLVSSRLRQIPARSLSRRASTLCYKTPSVTGPLCHCSLAPPLPLPAGTKCPDDLFTQIQLPRRLHCRLM